MVADGQQNRSDSKQEAPAKSEQTQQKTDGAGSDDVQQVPQTHSPPGKRKKRQPADSRRPTSGRGL